MEILKTLLRNRLTWATSKQKGITKATHQQIVAYLQELPDKDFVQELSEQCKLYRGRCAETNSRVRTGGRCLSLSIGRRRRNVTSDYSEKTGLGKTLQRAACKGMGGR